jgi:hypothetical protein
MTKEIRNFLPERIIRLLSLSDVGWVQQTLAELEVGGLHFVINLLVFVSMN